jgi:hypothetical protein
MKLKSILTKKKKQSCRYLHKIKIPLKPNSKTKKNHTNVSVKNNNFQIGSAIKEGVFHFCVIHQ